MSRVMTTFFIVLLLGLLSNVAPIAQPTAQADAAATMTANPFAGDYYWPSAPAPGFSYAYVTVDARGHISGTTYFQDKGFGGSWEWSGRVRANGSFKVRYGYTIGQLRGTATLDIDGNMIITTSDGEFVWYRQ